MRSRNNPAFHAILSASRAAYQPTPKERIGVGHICSMSQPLNEWKTNPHSRRGFGKHPNLPSRQPLPRRLQKIKGLLLSLSIKKSKFSTFCQLVKHLLLKYCSADGTFYPKGNWHAFAPLFSIFYTNAWRFLPKQVALEIVCDFVHPQNTFRKILFPMKIKLWNYGVKF